MTDGIGFDVSFGDLKNIIISPSGMYAYFTDTLTPRLRRMYMLEPPIVTSISPSIVVWNGKSEMSFIIVGEQFGFTSYVTTTITTVYLTTTVAPIVTYIGSNITWIDSTHLQCTLNYTQTLTLPLLQAIHVQVTIGDQTSSSITTKNNTFTIELDLCMECPCMNGGTCFTDVPAKIHVCACALGYGGMNCSVVIVDKGKVRTRLVLS
jgi:hypothetical protein